MRYWEMQCWEMQSDMINRTSKSIIGEVALGGKGIVVMPRIKSPRSDRIFNLPSPANDHNKA